MNPGEILAGRYLVDKVLGQGGMGVVVAGRHLQLGNRVAIKFLLAEAAHHPEATARFLREARAAVQIQSEHVARVSDVGTLDNGAPYMVMEFLNGSDLAKVLAERHGPFAIDEAIDYLLQACEAIAEAHALGIVHRDLKPANLFLTRRADGSPLVKVLDFGISKITAGQGADANMTATASVMGSPAYMSPEQVRSAKNVDTRTDIWSLGMILYEFLAGRPAFEAETMSGLLAQIVADPPTPLRVRRPDVPARLEAVVMRCLEKDLARRTRDVVEFAQAVLPFSPACQISVERIRRVVHGKVDRQPLPSAATPPRDATVWPEHPSVAAPSAGDSHRTVTAGSWGSTGNRPTGGRRTWIVAAISACALTGLGFAYYALRAPVTAAPGPIAAPMESTPTLPAKPSTPPVTTPASPLSEPPPTVVAAPEIELAPRNRIAPVPPATGRPAGPPRAAGPRPNRAPGAAAAPTGSAQPDKDLFDDIN